MNLNEKLDVAVREKDAARLWELTNRNSRLVGMEPQRRVIELMRLLEQDTLAAKNNARGL